MATVFRRKQMHIRKTVEARQSLIFYKHIRRTVLQCRVCVVCTESMSQNPIYNVAITVYAVYERH